MAWIIQHQDKVLEYIEQREQEAAPDSRLAVACRAIKDAIEHHEWGLAQHLEAEEKSYRRLTFAWNWPLSADHQQIRDYNTLAGFYLDIVNIMRHGR